MSRCAVAPNTDPRRLIPYCKPIVSLSEPLSHSEYLRRKKANNNVPISSTASLLQTGQGAYTRTIWTATANTCCALPAVPAAIPGTRNNHASAPSEGMRIMEVSATASRGTISHYDSTNHTEWNTTQRRAGFVIAADKYSCDATEIEGTTIVPGVMKCCD